ncbi:hypothetical protein A8950_1836 [Dongia mobilis]|uniref:Uncharacterized protein n=1 Tax=Dongia mobilis TaxID=578943 RepID=A0A4R6WQH2_9PROT|nr:hypothetical protein [Dongia mobilis]TDQ82016.1 hypothetical protein A8950_1836 [Dongia mobilis]
MKLVRAFFIFWSLLFFTTVSFLVTAKAQVADESNMSSTEGLSVDKQNTSSIENDALIQQWFAILGQSNDRMIATVYWALGVVAGTMVALVGYSWFTNYRVYERDKQALSSVLLAEVQSKAAEIRGDLQKLHEIHMAAIDSAITNSVEGKIASVSKELQEIQKRVASLRDRNSKLEKEMLLKITEFEVFLWEQRDVPANVLTTSMEVVSHALEIGYIWNAERALKKIEELQTKNQIEPSDFDSEMIAILDKLPRELSPYKERITGRLRQV